MTLHTSSYARSGCANCGETICGCSDAAWMGKPARWSDALRRQQPATTPPRAADTGPEGAGRGE